MQNQWFTISKEDYIVNVGNNVCVLAFIPHQFGNFWVFGTPILKGYYSVFDNADPTSAKLRVAPSATSSKPVLTSEGFPKA